MQVNGHLEHEINTVQPSQYYAQPAQLFWNCGDACPNRLVHVKNGGALDQEMVGRGAAYADVDADGDLDIAIAQNGRPTVLIRNDQATGHHWLRVKLKGNTSGHDAIGAVVELLAGGQTQRRHVNPARSYLSQVELPVTFGLGAIETVDSLTVRWPSGAVQEVTVDQVDQEIEVVEPAS